MAPKLTHNRVVVFHPGEEAMVPLGSVHMVFNCSIVNPSTSVPHIVSIFQHFCPLRCLRRPCCHLRSLQVQYTLLPPSLVHQRSWSPLRLQTQIQYRTSHNIFGCSVLEEGDVRLHLLQACRRHRLLQQWILPYPLYIETWLYPSHIAGHPVLETSQGSANPGGHNPQLQDK